MMISDTAMARIDPIVDRGEASAHVHHLNGAGSEYFVIYALRMINHLYRSWFRLYWRNPVWVQLHKFHHHSG